MEEWRRRASCRGLPASIFYGVTIYEDDEDQVDEESTDNHRRQAKEICSGCETQIECLDYAARNDEEFGIWGGIGHDRRNRVRTVLLGGDPIEYERALADEVEEIARLFNGAPDTRPETEERPCLRCDSIVPAGRHPVDRNGPSASCAKPSTFNRGCRCLACGEAKSKYMKANRRKKKRNPKT